MKWIVFLQFSIERVVQSLVQTGDTYLALCKCSLEYFLWASGGGWVGIKLTLKPWTELRNIFWGVFELSSIIF